MFGLFGNVTLNGLNLNVYSILLTKRSMKDARVAFTSDFKGKMHSQQNPFAKCITEMFALNYMIRFLFLKN